MSIFVIGDLHLSFGTDKPMDIFGWGNHWQKIQDNWIKNVEPQDTVVIPGDFSWAMQLEEADLDFEFVEKLPGKKIILKGNHDYWWNTLTKMDQYIKDKKFTTIEFLQNNSYLADNKIIAGTRGWTTLNWRCQSSYKILKRENERLKLSIESGISEFGKDKEILVFMHYPPFFSEAVPEEIDFIHTMQQYNVYTCYYAHLHGRSHKEAFCGEKRGVEFQLVSSDYLGFKLRKIG